MKKKKYRIGSFASKKVFQTNTGERKINKIVVRRGGVRL